MASQRERENYVAKLADQAKQYEEMGESMKKVANLGVDMTVEERGLHSAWSNGLIGARMASSTILSSIEQKEEAKGNEQHVKRIQECRQKVDLKFSNIFIDVMTVVDEHLIRSSSSGESSVFYYVAKLADQAKQYEEMGESMKKVANLGVDMTVEERDLLSA